MLEYAYGHDDVVARWVADRIPAIRGRGFGKCSAIGVVEGDELIAGWVYHNWNPEACVIEMSCASLPGRRWCTPETLKRMYQYAFITAGCQMVLQLNDAKDERLLRQLAALGYSLIRMPRMLGRDADAVVALLTVEDWADNKICKRYKHHIPDALLQHSEAA